MKTSTLIYMITLSAISLSAKAADQYRQMGFCGTATVVSGETCSNVKVQFQFKGCETKSEAEIAKRIDRKSVV